MKSTAPRKKATSTATRLPRKKAPARTGTSAKRPRKKSEPSAQELTRSHAMQAAQYALDKKAVDIHVLDLTAITSMTDFFVIVTGTSDRQVKAIAENVIAEMRDTQGVSPWRSEGWDGLHWVIIDFVDFVVHVFQADSRAYYNIERLWADAPMVEVSEESIQETPKGRKKKSPSATGTKIKVISDFKPVSAH